MKHQIPHISAKVLRQSTNRLDSLLTQLSELCIMWFMNSHRDCDKCNSDRLSRIMDDLREEGLTFSWTATGETREKAKWFNRGTKIQEKQVKIAMPPEMMPHGVYRWKTIEVRL